MATSPLQILSGPEYRSPSCPFICCHVASKVALFIVGSGLFLACVSCCVAGGAEAMRSSTIAILCAKIGGCSMGVAVVGMALGWLANKGEQKFDNSSPLSSPSKQIKPLHPSHGRCSESIKPSSGIGHRIAAPQGVVGDTINVEGVLSLTDLIRQETKPQGAVELTAFYVNSLQQAIQASISSVKDTFLKVNLSKLQGIRFYYTVSTAHSFSFWMTSEDMQCLKDIRNTYPGIAGVLHDIENPSSVL